MSGELAARLAVEVPKSLRTRPKDPRGYPIPWIVYVEPSGKPQFTINDPSKVEDCIRKRLCGLCGKRIVGSFWFIGGMRCFTHEHGAFIDPPMHEHCARYAIRVCPFLGAPSYGKRIDDKKLSRDAPTDGGLRVLVKDTTMPDDRPELFGLGSTLAYSLVRPSSLQLYFVVPLWELVEQWRCGQLVTSTGEPNS
jgi:hypothetical protein